MILQALYGLATYEELIAGDYEPKAVAWLITVNADGKLVGIQGTHYTPEAEGKKKPKEQPKDFLIPIQPKRQGKKAPAYFLVDNAKYVFGRSTEDKPFSEAEGREKSGWFYDLVEKCADATGDEGVIAVKRFLQQVHNGEQDVALPEKCKSNEQFAFVYEPDIDEIVSNRPAVKEYWAALRAAEPETKVEGVRCLVSGEPVTQFMNFPQVKLPGGNPAGSALISFNCRAFESYGWSGNENAPISQEAAEASATALKRLLDPAYPDPQKPTKTLPSRNIRLSADTVVCYWSVADSAQGYIDRFGPVMKSDEEEVESYPDEVKALCYSIWNGQAPGIDDSSAFYALTLSGAQGRAIVRDWFESKVNDVLDRLAQHFADLDIVRNCPPSKKQQKHPPGFPMRVVLESLADPVRSRSEGIPPPLASQMVRAVYAGTEYPYSALQRALMRYRMELGKAEDDWVTKNLNDARAAVIKAVLNRRRRIRKTSSYEEVRRDMDPTNTSTGYVLGRLMAVIERIQQEAQGNVNASVIDRYFSGASATPGAVFPRLLKNTRNHIHKIKGDKGEGGAVWMEKMLDEVLSGLDSFPSFIDLEQQGLFVLGYHHQRKWLWTSKEKRDVTETEQ